MNGVRSQPRLCRSSSGLSHWFRDIAHFVNIIRRILHFSALLLSVSLGSIMTLFGRFSYLFSLVFFYLSFLLRLFKKKWGKTNKFYYNINNRHKYSLPCNSFNFSQIKPPIKFQFMVDQLFTWKQNRTILFLTFTKTLFEVYCKIVYIIKYLYSY